MLIRDTILTPALARWLRESHDDGEPELYVRAMTGAAILVCRADATEPSATERTEVHARLAAHAVEPLQ